jgi:hypothetical protein
MEASEPIVQINQEPPVSTFYQYVPTEPTILSPYVEYVDPKQKEIDDLRQYKTQSEEKFEKMEQLIADQKKLLDILMEKLK